MWLNLTVSPKFAKIGQNYSGSGNGLLSKKDHLFANRTCFVEGVCW